MSTIVILLGVFVTVVVTCVCAVTSMFYIVKAVTNFNPTVKVVQEYNMVSDTFTDIYNKDGELNDKEELPNFDDILKEVRTLFTDDEVDNNE